MVSYHTHTHLSINELRYFLVANCDTNLGVSWAEAYKRKLQSLESLFHVGVPATKQFPGSEQERLGSHVSGFKEWTIGLQLRYPSHEQHQTGSRLTTANLLPAPGRRTLETCDLLERTGDVDEARLVQVPVRYQPGNGFAGVYGLLATEELTVVRENRDSTLGRVFHDVEEFDTDDALEFLDGQERDFGRRILWHSVEFKGFNE